VTVDDYERELEANLRRLHDSIHSGQYWPKPGFSRSLRAAGSSFWGGMST
jgi:hypothetical protein